MEPRSRLQQDTQDVADRARSSVWATRLFWYFVVFAVAPLIYGIGDLVLIALPGHKAIQSYHQWLMGNFLSGGALFLFWLFLCSLACLVITLVTAHRDDSSDYQMTYKPRELHKNVPHHRAAGVATAIAALVTGLVMVVSFVQFVRVAHNDSVVPERYYGPVTTIFVDGHPNANNAPSLTRLLPMLTPSNGTNGELVGAPSLPITVKQGSLPTTGWDPRVSSLNGAIYGIRHSSAAVQNTSLNDSTVTYLNSWRKQPARWSGILDGSGNGTGLGGVAEWDGYKVTNVCKFQGPYAADRSFGGSGDSDLNDLLAETYPGLKYNMSDVWGYCDGGEPVVVIPMIRQVYFQSRTVDTAAGIVKVQGNYGRTVLTYLASVNPGDYPGPVFPASIVDNQVNQVNWAAGRRWHDNNFGYEPVSSAAQAGNVSDYLLRDSATGRLMWVTPLTLNGSTSDVIVAYAVSYADQVTNGQLNPLSIYVLGPNDPRQVVIDSMESAARNWLSNNQPGFFSSGGVLSEFTPLGGNMWRAYGEVNGRVQYLLDFDATNINGTAKLTLVGAPTTSGPTLNCDNPSQLSLTQLAHCSQVINYYLAQKAGVPAFTGSAPSATATPSPTAPAPSPSH